MGRRTAVSVAAPNILIQISGATARAYGVSAVPVDHGMLARAMQTGASAAAQPTSTRMWAVIAPEYGVSAEDPALEGASYGPRHLQHGGATCAEAIF
jgi:hypothetical protein